MYKISQTLFLLNFLIPNFWYNRKIDNFDPYNVLLAIATNISVLLKTGFVVQGHIYYFCLASNQSL